MSARNRDSHQDREMYARLLRQVDRNFNFGRHEWDEPPEEWKMIIIPVPDWCVYQLFGEPDATAPVNKPSDI
jgi:hypothetical protein